MDIAFSNPLCGTVLLFAVPVGWSETAKLVYIFFSYNIAFTVLFTGINLPYAALTAMMAQDQYERSVVRQKFITRKRF